MVRANAIAEMLFKKGANPRVVDKEGHNAFYYAVVGSNIVTLWKFITRIPDINQPDNNGNTLLHHAADDDWVAPGKITELIIYGASVNVIDKTGKRPIILLLHSYGAFFDFVLDKYEIGQDCYAGLPMLLETLINQRPDSLHRDSQGASALNVTLRYFLIWLEKGAFQPKESSTPSRRSPKEKFTS